MKVAISGATGFIGRPLVRRLVDAGDDVVLLSRSPERLSDLPPRAEASFFDARAAFPPENLRGAEAVIHLAGETVGRRWNEAVKAQILESRVRGTQTIVHAARAAGTVKVLLSASGIGYYGDCGAEPVTEATPPGSDFLARVCQQWEAAAFAAESAGIRVAVFRLGLVLHHQGGALAKMLPAFRIGAGGPMGSGQQFVPFIHRDDVVALLLQALRDERFRGPFNAVAPNPVTNRDFARALGRALHRPALVPVPAVALRLLLGEMADSLLTGQRALPKRLEDVGFQFRFPDIDGALEDLLRTRSR